MKKVGILLVLMLFVLSVSGCRLFGHKKHNRNDYGCYDFSSSIPQTKFRVNKEPKLLKPKTESKPEQRETPKEDRVAVWGPTESLKETPKEPPKVERKVVEDRVAIYYPPKKPEDRVVEYGYDFNKEYKKEKAVELEPIEWNGPFEWHPEKKVEDRVVEYREPPKVEDREPPKVEDRLVECVKPLNNEDYYAKNFPYQYDDYLKEWGLEKKVEDRLIEYNECVRSCQKFYTIKPRRLFLRSAILKVCADLAITWLLSEFQLGLGAYIQQNFFDVVD
jgi:hypothetical protein